MEDIKKVKKKEKIKEDIRKYLMERIGNLEKIRSIRIKIGNIENIRKKLKSIHKSFQSKYLSFFFKLEANIIRWNIDEKEHCRLDFDFQKKKKNENRSTAVPSTKLL